MSCAHRSHSIIGFSDVIVSQKDPKTAEYAQHIAKSGAPSARRRVGHPRHLQDRERQLRAQLPAGRPRRHSGRRGRDDARNHRGEEPDARRARAARPADARRRFQAHQAGAGEPSLQREQVHVRARPHRPGGARQSRRRRQRRRGRYRRRHVARPDRHRAQAFRPWCRANLSRTQEGAGLGLPIARGLARQHGGDIFIESKPGQGTTVLLTLPRSAAP